MGTVTEGRERVREGERGIYMYTQIYTDIVRDATLKRQTEKDGDFNHA